jgi:hypothetical protein
MGKCQTRLAHLAQDEDDNLKINGTMDSSDGEEDASVAAPSPPSKLSIFHEDILLSILSYVADVPFEEGKVQSSVRAGQTRSPTDSHSTLTHTLPLVSKQFHKLTTDHDLYWKQALLRLVEKEPTLWKEGVERVIFDAKCDELRMEVRDRNRSRARRGKRTKEGQMNEPQQQPPQAAFESKISAACNSEKYCEDKKPSIPISEEEELLQTACVAIKSNPTHDDDHNPRKYQCLYQSIVQRNLHYKASVFYMPQHLKLGNPYGLHFFEPRYRVLISEVMGSFPVSARRGEQIVPMVPGLFPPPRDRGQVMGDDIKSSLLDLLETNDTILNKYQYPTFIHAHQSPLRRNSPATIVQVIQCHIQQDGSADVFMKPLAYIWLKDIWEKPGTGGLMEARGIRMGAEASKSYELQGRMSVFGMGDGRGRGQQLPIP